MEAAHALVVPVGLSLAVAIVAALVGRFAPKHRHQVRSGVRLLFVYLLVFGLEQVLVLLTSKPSSLLHFAHFAAQLLALATAIKVGGLVVFDLVLPALRTEVASIVEDIVVGAGYIVALMLTLRQAGVNLSGLVTTSAVVTGIIALSFQGTLTNVVGGLALQIDRSIRAGDWIQLENGKQGKVREIRWRHTVIETRDWDTIVLPNSSLLNAQFTILGKREGEPVQHRMTVHFHVDFRTSPERVIEVVNQALSASPFKGVAERPAAYCLCLDIGSPQRDSVAHYIVWYWLVDLARDEPTSSLVRARVHAALARAGIPLAIPARRLFLAHEDDARRQRKSHEDMLARRAALRSVELLAPLHDHELDQLALGLTRAPFAAGEVVTKQGDVTGDFYILTRGTAEVWVSGEGGETKVADLAAPAFFGEMSLMTGEPRAATVLASSALECFRLESTAFQSILEERPEVVNELSERLAERRVQLLAAREGLDAAAKAKRISAEKSRLLDTIGSFLRLGRPSVP